MKNCFRPEWQNHMSNLTDKQIEAIQNQQTVYDKDACKINKIIETKPEPINYVRQYVNAVPFSFDDSSW